MSDTQWCNWSFDEFISKDKWLVKRDCSAESITLSRGDDRNWLAYKKSLEPHYQGTLSSGHCPNCGRNINGVNPYDDGETWRKQCQTLT